MQAAQLQQLCSSADCQFLNVQAIDLIDEAGSRVRLQHAQLPEEARELDKELRNLLKDKDAAVRGQDFEKAGSVSTLSRPPCACMLVTLRF